SSNRSRLAKTGFHCLKPVLT
ncbi:hypothetical protein CP02DC14_1671B, partial [Chlamydia psittaci 02DC14]